MYNPTTKRIILSRDVKWAEFKKIDPKENMDIFIKYNSTDTVPGIDEINVNIENGPKNDSTEVQEIQGDKNARIEKVTKMDENEPKVKVEPNRLEREMRRLDTSYNRTVKTEDTENVRDGNVVVTGNSTAVPIEMPKEEEANYHAEVHNTAVNSDVGDPKTFYEAINSKRGKMWKLSMISEVNNFLYRDAWIPRKLAKVRQKGRKPISVKWVFKTKLEANGSERLKSRIVTKGYLQVPGVDFTEKFSPVANDTSTRILIGMTLYFSDKFSWVCETFDVEAAFLEPYLDIEMYIDWPEGIVDLGFISEEQKRTTCIQLRRSMYGNVDAALRWQRDFTEFLVSECNFKACKSDPCILFLTEDEQLKVVMSTHVDDSMCVGSREDLDKLYRNVRKKYKITTLGRLKKYLGVHYDWQINESGEQYVIVTMSKNAEEIVEYYEKVTGEKDKLAKTPGFQNTVLSKNDGEIIMLEEYRLLVGKLLYYIVKVGPDCANAVRDLARDMSSPG